MCGYSFSIFLYFLLIPFFSFIFTLRPLSPAKGAYALVCRSPSVFSKITPNHLFHNSPLEHLFYPNNHRKLFIFIPPYKLCSHSFHNSPLYSLYLLTPRGLTRSINTSGLTTSNIIIPRSRPLPSLGTWTLWRHLKVEAPEREAVCWAVDPKRLLSSEWRPQMESDDFLSALR